MTVTIPYVYRNAFLPFHQRKERDAVMVCHRRAGKTVALVNDLQLRALDNKRVYPPPRYAFFYPSRVRAKDIAWPYMKHFSSTIPGRKVMESELTIEYPNKARVTLYGADNSRGVGLYLDGVVYDERDQIPPKTIVEIEPTLTDYKGWSVHAGMLKGRFNLWKAYEEARKAGKDYTLLMKATESGIIPADELERLRLKMGESAFQMELECNPNASMANAIYGAEMDEMRLQHRIGSCNWDKEVPLDFFFDIGHSLNGDDWTFWAVQLSGRDILFQAYYACTGKHPSHYAGKVMEIAAEAGMHVGTVFLPHDGNRMDQQGHTTKQFLEDAGIQRIKIVSRTPDRWTSINVLRALLARVYINEERCGKPWILGEQEMPSGIDCLDFYTKKVEEQTGMITEVPVHNEFSHGADAARTFAEAYANKMLDGTSLFAAAGRMANINVSRERVTPMERPRMRINVTR